MGNLKDLDLEKVLGDKINFGKIKALCPTLKLNFNQEDRNHAIGMHLLITQDIESVTFDLDNLNDETLLFLDKRQIIECISIIDGMLYLLMHNHLILKSARDSYIDNLLAKLNNGIIRYKNLIKIADELKFSTTNDVIKDKLLERVTYVTKNIWFMPYGEMDRIFNEVSEEYDKGRDQNADNTDAK